MIAALFMVLLQLPHAEVAIDELLVLGATAPGRRSPVVVDAIEAQLARGTFRAPAEGLEVPRADQEPLIWRRLEAGDDGQFSDEALRGGWAFAEIERSQAGVLLLEARGHRRVYVNGVARGGDVYGLGLTILPIALRAGTNELLFRGGRGSLRAKLVEAPAHPYLVEHDRMLPDVLREDSGVHVGVRVGNPSTQWVEVSCTSGPGWAHSVRLAPLSVTQVPFRVSFAEPPGADVVHVTLGVHVEGERVDTTELELAVKDRHEPHKRTFVSSIDGSVQYYAVTPPPAASGASDQQPALFLSLHGASVEATNQAYSYAPKDWGVVVAPTNRRAFGFDWEDWGRLDALEVFALARSDWNTDPRRQYLTGHSMGGHGTWNLGAHLPGTFAAIAPSAGWRDFWSYGTASDEELHAVDELLRDAANASRTLLLEENYLHAGVYVLHGDADRNVPVEQARFMRERLAGFHPNFTYYEQPGAGHWWGSECLDWPPLFRFLKDNVSPAPRDVHEVSFATVNPAINATCQWVTIQAQERSLEVSRARVELDAAAGRITAETENVAALTLDLAAVLADGTALSLELDDTQLALPWPAAGRVHLALADGAWRLVSSLPPSMKSPARAGPFKDAFRGHMVLVYGTRGSAERTARLFERARFDAETFAYRGNGSLEIRADTDFDPFAHPDRHVILYGNADDNALWLPLLGESPVQVAEGAVRIGERTLEGDDLAVLFLRPHPASATAAVAAISATGGPGLRLCGALPYFVSGVGYPDWTVIGAELLERGAEGIRAAGFFGPDWSLERGRAAWR